MEFKSFTSIQKQGFIGSALVFIGCFLPFVYFPMMGGASLFNVGGWGFIILLLSITLGILTYLDKHRVLKILSIITTVLLVLSFIKLEINLSEFRKSDPIGIFKMAKIGAGYAWFFLFGGCAVLLATTIFNKQFIKG